MPDIQHYLTIDAPPAQVFGTVDSAEAVASWWTPDVTGDASIDGVFRAEFRTGGFGEFRVVEVLPDRAVAWECIANDAAEWIGTHIRFDVQPAGEGSVLRFTHSGWAEATDFMASCNFFWGRLLERLARLAVSGEGLQQQAS